MNKLVYIGSGLDIVPLIILDHVTEFIYIDSRPCSEFGMDYYGDEKLYCKTFLNDLDFVLKNNNYILIVKSENYLEYTNYEKILKYYINTPFPEMINDEILDILKDSENLVLSGYDPNKKILEIMSNLKNIFINNHTVFDTYYKNFFQNKLEKNNSSFHYLNENNGDYNYFLMKETKTYLYWIKENILPRIKEYYNIISVKNLLYDKT